MFLSVVASRTVNLSLGLRPVNSPVSAHSAPSDDNTASPARSECSYSCGAPKFQFTRLRFFKPNLSTPKAPLCTPVSCTKIPSSNPRVSITRSPPNRVSCTNHQYGLADLIVRNAELAKPIPYDLVYCTAHEVR